MKSKTFAIIVLAGALASSNAQAVTVTTGSIKTPGVIKFVTVFTAICATGIIGAALAKNSQQNKPLTASEATSCGWRFWVR